MKELLHYQPTEEEKRLGLSSSVKSKGVVGVINRALARLTKQKEVDVVGFVSDIWDRKLIRPPEDFYR